MKPARWKVSTRLAAGFGCVLLALALVAAAGIVSLERVGGMNAALLEQDWARAEAAGVINVMTRENARQTMQLFIVPDAQRPAVLARIAANKKLISETLDILNSMKVTALFAVDAGRPVGVIHVHDLLRAGAA